MPIVAGGGGGGAAGGALGPVAAVEGKGAAGGGGAGGALGSVAAAFDNMRGQSKKEDKLASLRQATANEAPYWNIIQNDHVWEDADGDDVESDEVRDEYAKLFDVDDVKTFSNKLAEFSEEWLTDEGKALLDKAKPDVIAAFKEKLLKYQEAEQKKENPSEVAKEYKAPTLGK